MKLKPYCEEQIQWMGRFIRKGRTPQGEETYLFREVELLKTGERLDDHICVQNCFLERFVDERTKERKRRRARVELLVFLKTMMEVSIYE